MEEKENQRMNAKPITENNKTNESKTKMCLCFLLLL